MKFDETYSKSLQKSFKWWKPEVSKSIFRQMGVVQSQFTQSGQKTSGK